MKKHEIENNYIIAFIQAMIGGITNNFRAVWINRVKEGEEKKIELSFLLAEENEIDREEIEDIIFESEALLDDMDIEITPNVIIDDKAWLPPKDIRIIFSKKQN